MDRPETTRTVEVPTTDPDPDSSRDACRNCGAALSGPYCSECGQKHSPTAQPLRRVIADWAEEVASLDSRLLRTLGTLFLRPGRLTADYNAGRRVRYVPPVRLYMVASVAFFFVLAMSPEVPSDMEVSADGEAIGLTTSDADGGPGEPAPGAGTDGAAAPAGDAAGDRPEDVIDTATAASTGRANASDNAPTFETWILEQTRGAVEDGAEFARFLLRIMAWSMFVLLPIAALLLATLYRRPKRYYVEHLVFTLHAHTFAFIVFSAATVLVQVTPGQDSVDGSIPGLIASTWIAVYIFVALMRTYGEGIVRTAVKYAVLATAYTVVLGIVMAGAALVALGLF